MLIKENQKQVTLKYHTNISQTNMWFQEDEAQWRIQSGFGGGGSFDPHLVFEYPMIMK